MAGGRNSLSIYEDGTAHFTLSAHPPSYQDLTVSVTVATTGDFGVQTGAKQITVPARMGSAALSIPPVPDHVHEPDGSITVTLNADSSYEVVSPSSGSVEVKDDDPPVSIDDAPDKAGAGGKPAFAVTLSHAAEGEVSLDYEIFTFSPMLFPEMDFQDDDGGVSGAITFAAGEIEKVINVHTGDSGVQPIGRPARSSRRAQDATSAPDRR